MKDVPAEELVQALVQQSKMAHCRSSKCVCSPEYSPFTARLWLRAKRRSPGSRFRGVWSTDDGKYECKYTDDD
jgi:hypothetical protein